MANRQAATQICAAYLIAAGVIAALTFAQFRIFAIFHVYMEAKLVEATSDFFSGHTHWRIFQSRILGPAIVEGIQWLDCHFLDSQCKYGNALYTYHFLSMLVSNFLFFTLVKRLGVGLLETCIFTVTFIGFQVLTSYVWYLPWDVLDLMLFTLMLLLDVRRRRPIVFFYVLSFFWMLTKETALFAPAWLLLSRFQFRRGMTLFDAARSNVRLLAHVSILSLIIVVTISLLRESLFVSSILPGVGSDSGHGPFGQHIQAIFNLKSVTAELWKLINLSYFLDAQHPFNLTYAATMAVATAFAVFFGIAKSILDRELIYSLRGRLMLFAGLYWLNLFLFGNILELRLYGSFSVVAICAWYLFSFRSQVSKPYKI